MPVLAPKNLDLTEKDLLILIRDLINNVLMGIKVYHSIGFQKEMNTYLELTNKYDLLISGGSDFHGPKTKPNINIGPGNNNLMIKKLSLLNELKKII